MDFLDANNLALVVGGVAVGAAAMTLLGGSAGAAKKKTGGRAKYVQDGPEAREIAEVIPYYPFKGIDRFYDIGGFLKNPAVFQKIVDIFAERYGDDGLQIDAIGGLDARGFVLGPPIALALGKPFFMIRKSGKMPNSVQSAPYSVEYGKRDGLCIPKDAVTEGQRVLLIDDLVATGGTLAAGIQCVKALGGKVIECACVVELKLFIDPPADSPLPNRTKMFKSFGFEDVPIWGLISEDVLLNKAELAADYKDDGEEH